MAQCLVNEQKKYQGMARRSRGENDIPNKSSIRIANRCEFVGGIDHGKTLREQLFRAYGGGGNVDHANPD